MKTILRLLLLLFCAGAAFTQQIQVVVPGDLAQVEGNSATGEPFNSTSFRFQQVFDASQFAIPAGASGRVDSISFRIDGASTDRVLLFFGGGSVVLSTTAREPDGLSAIFEENRGADGTTIFSGGLSFGGFVQPGSSPQPFMRTLVAFGGDSFFYIPSQGNLLLDVSGAGGQAFLPGSLDAHATLGDAISWVWSPDGNLASGTANTLGLVTRFDITIIPEPATWMLGLAALSLFAVLRRR